MGCWVGVESDIAYIGRDPENQGRASILPLPMQHVCTSELLSFKWGVGLLRPFAVFLLKISYGGT